MKPHLIIMFSCLISACDFFSMDRVPSESQIKTNFEPFLVEGSSIRGIYSNMDVDSFIFMYKTESQNPLAKISENLSLEDWSVISENDNQLVITRRKSPGEGELNFYSFELAKVSLANGYICVGYVQSDTKTLVKSLYGDEASEIQWADKHIWPKYNSCVNSHNKSINSQP